MSFTKCVWTLNVNNYEPEICRLTYPLIENYAEKINADNRVITERKYPDFPPVYEKLQLYELGREYEWNIFVDSDALIHPNMLDVTEVVSKDTVVHNGIDYAANRFTYDEYFRRDGRHIASCNWFTVASNWCLDLWKPLDDISLEDAVKRIKPINAELNFGIRADHLIDDFTLSRNIAKYGLKCTTVRDIVAKIGQIDAYFLWHQYLLDGKQKLAMIKEMIKIWQLGKPASLTEPIVPEVQFWENAAR